MPVDPTLDPYFLVTEVAAGDVIIAGAFERKFGDPPPDVGHHIVAFYTENEPALVPVSYVHFRAFGDICLVGGGMTDGSQLRKISAAASEALRRADGLLLQTLRYGFEHISPNFDATFGYCGDARAKAVDLKAGFEPTDTPRLLIYRNRPLHPNIERALLAKATALGPF